jgi:hypothetical protein
MGKRGPKPKKIIDTKWSTNLAYAIGLIATDGCLSGDGLLVDLTSKDKEQLENYLLCLNTKLKIGKKYNGIGGEAFRVQFKNRIFYDFLLSIGLTQRKSLTMGKLNIPEKYFFNFLRGCFDGDGCTYSYWDPRWRSSYMFYISFASGSKKFVSWLQDEIYKRLKIKNHMSIHKKKEGKNPYYQLKYSKYSAIKLIKEMYKGKNKICLKRKRLKINESFSIIGELELV